MCLSVFLDVLLSSNPFWVKANLSAFPINRRIVLTYPRHTKDDFVSANISHIPMYGVFNTSLQGLWLHLATTKIFAWPHATLVFAGTPKDMLPQTQSARKRHTPSSAGSTEWLICPRTTGYVVHGEHQVANLPADDGVRRSRSA